MAAKTVRIGCAAGFWGDTETAAPQLLKGGQLDYLVFDYLAEITMSIMAGQRLRRADGGHAFDFVSRVMKPCLADVMQQGVKVVTNAGGVNPLACRDALRAMAEEQGLKPRIAVVVGDDLMEQRDVLRQQGVREMFCDEALPEFLLSMNAYLGARPVVQALARGADIVITGRLADSALVLGPLVHEHGWDWKDYDRISAGSLAGHIVECGAQATGGLLTDWERVVEGYDDMGFPVVECAEDGSFVLEKPEGTGGLVDTAVVHEQLVYEIGDPRAYLLPDVTCDWTQVSAEALDAGRVRVRGAKGRPPPATYKVSATYPDGHRTTAGFLLAGEQAVQKGEAVAQALLDKTERLIKAQGFAGFRERRVDILGGEACYGPHSRASHSREVVVRIAVRHDDPKAIKLMLRELPQAGTGMAPGFTGGPGGRPGASPVIRLFSFLIDPARLKVQVELEGEVCDVAVVVDEHWDSSLLPDDATAFEAVQSPRRLPLIKLAHGRSGDKGNHANVGIVARKPEYVPLIGAALTAESVAEHMGHLIDPETGRVQRWAMPGCSGFNFLLENSLGGGGIASLRPDPQGKTYAQQLLAFEVPVPEDVYRQLGGET